MANKQEREYLYKILVVGEVGVGKTSIIRRYVHGVFSQFYKATIGVDFAMKIVRIEEGVTVRIQLWDVAGQERFGNMLRLYFRNATGACVVYDCTRPATLELAKKWKAEIDSKVTLPDGSPLPCILLGNKSDLVSPGTGRGKTPAQMDQFCEENGFVGWMETSAKTGANIPEACTLLVKKILEKEVKTVEPRKDAVVVGSQAADKDAANGEKRKKGCC